jgi:hypothetical protein
MSMLPQSDAASQLRLRAEEVLERKGAGVRRAGELAGHFAAMLETLNGVDAGNRVDAAAADLLESASAAQPRLGVGAVSVFAEQTDDGPQTPDAPQASGTTAKAVVDSALGAATPADFRWLTTLFTQAGGQG